MVLAATVREAGRRFGDLTALVDPDGSTVSYRAARRAVRRRRRRCSPAAAWPRATGWCCGSRPTAATSSPTPPRPSSAPSPPASTPGWHRPSRRRWSPWPTPRVVLSEPGEVASLVAEGAALVSSAARAGPLPDDPDRPVAIVFTSGTTGLPKGAVFCERQLEAVAVADTGGAWAPPGQPGPAMLASTQFAHIGITTKLPWYLRMATRTHILGRWRAERRPAHHRRAAHPDDRRRGTPARADAALARGRTARLGARADDRDRRRGIAARPGGGGARPRSARPTRSATRRPSRAGAAPAPPSTPTRTRRCTASAGRGAASRCRPATKTDARSRPARWASCGCAPRPRCRATGATPRPPRRPSPPTAGCGRATSPASRPTAWCASPGGPRRCSSAAGTTCTRPRSRPRWPPTPGWPTWRWCPGPTR